MRNILFDINIYKNKYQIYIRWQTMDEENILRTYHYDCYYYRIY